MSTNRHVYTKIVEKGLHVYKPTCFCTRRQLQVSTFSTLNIKVLLIKDIYNGQDSNRFSLFLSGKRTWVGLTGKGVGEEGALNPRGWCYTFWSSNNSVHPTSTPNSPCVVFCKLVHCKNNKWVVGLGPRFCSCFRIRDPTTPLRIRLSRFKYNYESSFLGQRHVVKNLFWTFRTIYGG